MSIATRILERFEGDRQSWRDASGVSLGEVIADCGGWDTDLGDARVRYDFADGSAVATCSDGWDVVAEGCAGACLAILGCDCGKATL